MRWVRLVAIPVVGTVRGRRGGPGRAFMTQSPSSLETTSTYAPPTVTQFSVFLENKVGKLHEVVRAFDNSPVVLCALSVHDAADHAVVRIVTNNAQETRL